MGESKKRCFVVMGFGIKTDYVSGRKLDLNKSYKYLIKPVVESKGIECVRADEILHSGSIDVQMYKELSKPLLFARPRNLPLAIALIVFDTSAFLDKAIK